LASTLLVAWASLTRCRNLSRPPLPCEAASLGPVCLGWSLCFYCFWVLRSISPAKHLTSGFKLLQALNRFALQAPKPVRRYFSWLSPACEPSHQWMPSYFHIFTV
jgi:hypothetical protein